VFNHVLYKALLFMVVGLLIARTGRERLSELGGLGRRMPLTAATFVVAAFAIAGVPGFNGFVSKTVLLDAAAYDGFDGDAVTDSGRPSRSRSSASRRSVSSSDSCPASCSASAARRPPRRRRRRTPSRPSPRAPPSPPSASSASSRSADR
jgi:hypothetical protein